MDPSLQGSYCKGATCQNDVRRQMHHFNRISLHLDSVGARIALFDLDRPADRPSERVECVPERLKITLRVRVVLGDPQNHSSSPHRG